MEYWSIGVLECWGDPILQYSNIPILHFFMRRELRLKLQRLRSKMKSTLSPLDSNKRDERIEATREDDDAFGRVYTPFFCGQDVPDFHHELSEGYDLRGCEIQGYGAPRGHGKTTRALIRLAREICHVQRHRITVISASEDLAEELIEPLKIALEENPRILQDFGDLIKRGGAGEFWTRQEVHFTAKGRGEKLRGPRNDLILLDDIEDDQQARNKERTDTLLDTIFETIYNRLIPVSDGGSTFIWIGTILARKSGLARVLNLNQSPEPEFPEVLGKIWKAIMIDENGGEYSLWPERFPLEELYKIRRRIGTRRFNKEYQNDPRDEDSVFQEGWFQGFHPLEFQELAKAA